MMTDQDDDRETPVPGREESVNDNHEGDPTTALRHSMDAIEAKLQRPGGWEGLAGWLDEVEKALAAVDDAAVDRTRTDIRDLIDELLELNAHIQNVLRLKQLLS